MRKPPIAYMPFALRLASFTDPEACWEWPGATNRKGYALVTLPAKNARGYATRIGHRAAYEMLVGPIPDDKELDHTCSNRRCLNPRHLEPVPHRENVRRGESANRRKTHCVKGHAFTRQNTRWRIEKGHRKRTCIECARAKSREYQRRRRQKSAA